MGKRTKPAVPDEDLPEIKTDLYRAVEGPAADVSLVFASYYPVPFDAEEINSCVIEVKSFPDRTEWTPILELPLWVQSMTRLAAGGFLLACDDGTLIKVVDDLVQEIPLPITSAITAIWERGIDDYWICHGTGIVHWDGKKTLSRSVETGQILDMHARGCDFAVAVGDDGIVMAFDGNSWNEIDSVPTNKTLNGVVCVGSDEIYIAGWGGTLYKWDGQAHWQKIKYVGEVSGSDMSGGSLASYRGTVYLCADGYGLYRINGKKAEPAETFYAARGMVVHDKLIITGENMYNEYDGNEWIQVEMSM